MAENKDVDNMDNAFHESINDAKADNQPSEQTHHLTKEQLEQAIREATRGY